MITEFILETLYELGKFSIDFIDAMASGHGASYKKLRRMITYGPFYRELFVKPKHLNMEDYRRKKRQQFYNLLYHLQKDGLVEKVKNRGRRSAYWKITEKGNDKLRKIMQRHKIKLPKHAYRIEEDKKLKVFIFDIPEKEKRKRWWLRSGLVALGFQKLQKSVWIGQNKLPSEFMQTIKDLNLLPYVEIFAVDKTGSINRLKS